MCNIILHWKNNWINIVYFNPNPKYHEEGGHGTNLTHWNNYTILLPAAALTPNTRIRWYQDISTNYDYDHWGLDNIGFTRIADIPEVYKNKCFSYSTSSTKLAGYHYSLWYKTSMAKRIL